MASIIQCKIGLSDAYIDLKRVKVFQNKYLRFVRIFVTVTYSEMYLETACLFLWNCTKRLTTSDMKIRIQF